MVRVPGELPRWPLLVGLLLLIWRCVTTSRVNFNDGTAGGEVLEMNLVMNFVRESGDHGMFNSWQVLLSYNALW